MAQTVRFAAATQSRGRIPRYFAPAVLATLLAAVIVVIVTPVGRSGANSRSANSRYATVRSLPSAVRGLAPYWTVRTGDTYARISEKTGLTIDQLEALNPNTGPNSLVPGQRLKLWLHPPAPRPAPLGPGFWTVRPGESLGLIAAKTGINLVKLERLNPRLKSTTLQPGDRVRLRIATAGEDALATSALWLDRQYGRELIQVPTRALNELEQRLRA